MRSALIHHPDIITNLPKIVDKFQFRERTSELIKASGPIYLFQELEDQCLVHIGTRSISNLQPLIEQIEEDNHFLKIEFALLLEDLDDEVQCSAEEVNTHDIRTNATSEMMETDAEPIV